MSTITINQTVETAVKTMLNKHATDAVKALSEKYGFPLDEALEELDLGNARVTKKEKSVKEPSSPKSKSKSEPKGKGKGKGKSKAKEESSEKKPRKPSGYQAYMKAMRSEVKKELSALSMDELQTELDLEDEPEKFHPKHVMTCLGKRWKALAEDEREEWIAQASSSEESE